MRQVLQVERARVRGLGQHVETFAAVDVAEERVEAVGAEVRVDGHGVGAEPGQDRRRVAVRGRVAEQVVGVRRGGRGDVAALGVGDDEQAARARLAHQPLERRPPRRAQPLEEGDLRLHHRDQIGHGVEQLVGEALHRRRRHLAVGARREMRERRRKELELRIDAQADRAALVVDRAVEPVGEARSSHAGGASRRG